MPNSVYKDISSVVQHRNPLRPHQGSQFSQPTSKSWILILLWPEQDLTMALSNICSAGKWCGLVWDENTSFVYGEQFNLYVCNVLSSASYMQVRRDALFMKPYKTDAYGPHLWIPGRATTQMRSVKKMQMHHAWNLFSVGCDLSNAFYNGTNNGNCYDETTAARPGPFLRYKGGHYPRIIRICILHTNARLLSSGFQNACSQMTRRHKLHLISVKCQSLIWLTVTN